MNFIKKIRAGAYKAADLAQQTVEVTKLNAQIAVKRKEAEHILTELGRVVYVAYKAGDLSIAEGRIDELGKANLAVESEIAELERQIVAIKMEKRCDCGHIVAGDAKFCPNCGCALQEQAPVAVAIEVVQPVKICSDCASELEHGAKFCHNCGLPVHDSYGGD